MGNDAAIEGRHEAPAPAPGGAPTTVASSAPALASALVLALRLHLLQHLYLYPPLHLLHKLRVDRHTRRNLQRERARYP
jgi:hypothetical protein